MVGVFILALLVCTKFRCQAAVEFESSLTGVGLVIVLVLPFYVGLAGGFGYLQAVGPVAGPRFAEAVGQHARPAEPDETGLQPRHNATPSTVGTEAPTCSPLNGPTKKDLP
jgi:hypothetical protein